MEPTDITFASKRDAHNFVAGMPVCLTMSADEDGTTAVRLGLVHPDAWFPALREFGDRFGWTPRDWSRDAALREIVVRVKLRACGHAARFTIDEEELARCTPREFIEYVCRTVERPPRRRCHCVQREVRA